jgi:hypothetical protein
MSKLSPCFQLVLAAVSLFGVTNAQAAYITAVAETGGDNDADTIPAKYTGETWTITTANRPFTGAVVGNSYTVLSFGNGVPSFVDRNHRYFDDPGTGGNPALNIPAYLIDGDYIMTGNDNRDNATYRLDVTVGVPVTAYMLIDNRLQDGNNADPPTFGAANMQWILNDGWTATSNGLNRFSNPGVPDEVGFDEAQDNDIDQWYSVYRKDFPAGTFSLFQADNTGRNMYGVVIVPEPATASLAAAGIAALLRRRRR